MNAETLTRGLETERFGRRVVYAEVVDSTNDRAAAALAAASLPEGTTFVAGRQTRGKGTRGNRWYSADPQGLWFSLVLLEPVRQQPLSFLPCIALVDVLRQQYDLPAHLKWPNDVLIEDRKLAGCLVESQRQPDRRLAWILGLGINVNQTQFEAPIADRAVSMRLVTGGTYSREELFQRVMRRIESIYDQGRDLVAMWRERTEMLGKRLRFRREGSEIAATALDLTKAGHLQVMLDDGRREEWLARVDMEME